MSPSPSPPHDASDRLPWDSGFALVRENERGEEV